MPKPISIYVDADACPVKNEVYRVAERHGLEVHVVSNSPIAVPREPWIKRVVVGAATDAADDWIAGGATVIAPNGKPFDENSIGMTVATRNLLHELRSAGAITGGPRPFDPRDRSRFLSALHEAIVRLKRHG